MIKEARFDFAPILQSMPLLPVAGTFANSCPAATLSFGPQENTSLAPYFEANADVHPQDIQRKFPQFPDLERDLLEVNQRLINYRQKMYEIIKGA